MVLPTLSPPRFSRHLRHPLDAMPIIPDRRTVNMSRAFGGDHTTVSATGLSIALTNSNGTDGIHLPLPNSSALTPGN